MTYHFNVPLYEHDQVTESFDFKESFGVINIYVKKSNVSNNVLYEHTIGVKRGLETLQQITKTFLALFK